MIQKQNIIIIIIIYDWGIVKEVKYLKDSTLINSSTFKVVWTV